MACPDASAAIHECVLAIKARVPVDVLAETIHAFPSTSRIFNGLFAEALATLDSRSRGTAGHCTATAAGALHRARGDLTVHEHQPRPGVPQRAADLDRLVERRRRQHDDVGAMARRPAARGRAPRRTAPGRRTRPGASATARSRWPGPSGATPAGHDGAARVTAQATPGHGSTGSTGASVPVGMSAPVARDRPERIGPGVGAVAPQPARLLRVAPDVDGLERRGDARARRTAARRPGGRAACARSGARAASRRRSGRGRRARPGPPRRRSRGSGSRSRAPRPASACAWSTSRRREPHAVPAVRRLGLARRHARAARAGPPCATRASRRRTS